MGWALDNLGAGRCREIAEELIQRGGGRVTKREDSRGELIGLCPLHRETTRLLALIGKRTSTTAPAAAAAEI